MPAPPPIGCGARHRPAAAKQASPRRPPQAGCPSFEPHFLQNLRRRCRWRSAQLGQVRRRRRRRAPARPLPALGSTGSGSSSRIFSSRSMSARKSSPASSSLIRRIARRAVALDHLAVVALGDLAHLVVELDLLDRLQHQLLLAFELAHAARGRAAGRRRARLGAGQRVDHPPERARRQRQRHPAQRDHHQRRAEAQLLEIPRSRAAAARPAAPQDPHRNPAPAAGRLSQGCGARHRACRQAPGRRCSDGLGRAGPGGGLGRLAIR